MCQCCMPGYDKRRGNSALIVYRYVKRVEEFGFTVFFFHLLLLYFKLRYKLL